MPAQTAADGAETTLAEQPMASADEAGDATITFTSPGWHRIKAIAAGALRSNRIDVCVCAPGQARLEGQTELDAVTTAPR